MRVHGTFSRVGCLSYKRQDGSTQVEYRPEEEVANRDSILSLGGLPVTLEHPPELLTPANTRQYQRGSTGTEVKYDNGFVRGVVILTDADAIAAVERGDAKELSVGYRVQIDRTPGVTATGERYDAIQRRISGNHLAVTREGRSGPEIRLHMDSQLHMDAAFSIDPPASPPSPPSERHEMSTAVQALSSATETLANALANQSRADSKKRAPMPMDGMDPEEEEPADPEMDPEAMDEEAMEPDEMAMAKKKPMARQAGRRDSAGAVPREEYNRVVTALAKSIQAHEADLGRMDAINERLTELEQDLETRLDASEIDLDALVTEKLELLERANALAGERLDHAGLSPRELQIAAMQKTGVGTDRFDGKSDEYVAAAFDNYCEAGSAGNTGRFDTASALELLLGKTTGDTTPDPRAAYEKRMEQTSRQPLTQSA